MTPTEALSIIYAMRESIANGWKPNQDQELALALADMLDEVKVDAERYKFLRSKAVYEGSSDWTIEIWGRFATIEEAIDAARSNNEPF